MAHYLVLWKIDIEADTPKEAALEALRIQRDPESIATVFELTDNNGVTIEIDLIEETN